LITTLVDSSQETLAQINEEKKIRKTNEVFILFALGSQFDHLIKQHLDKLGVFCLVADPASIKAEDIKRLDPIGLILSGGPASVHIEAPPFDTEIFDLNIPVLGICLGFQLWAQARGLHVSSSEKREFGTHALKLLIPDDSADGALFADIETGLSVLQSHGDRIGEGPKLTLLASTDNAPVAAARLGHLWGVQFHPEVTETVFGTKLFDNFVFHICGAKDRYPAADMANQKIAELKDRIGGNKVLLALSGGSDSSVVAHLLGKAVNEKPGQIFAVYIKGIDRPDDEAHVRQYFGELDWLSIRVVDATAEFIELLKGKTSMRDKRLAMRGVYKLALESEAKRVGASFITQGTLYTDISESGGGYRSGAAKAQIKQHHNTNLNFDLDELTPLDDCVKDNARDIGRQVGVPEALLVRHPFPGPGLVVRIEGEVTAERLAIARKLDEIYITELRGWGLYQGIWQAGVVVTNSEATCSKGDDAALGAVVAIWAVWSVNGFTAQWAELPFDFLRHVSRRMTNEVREVGAVTYRVSDKPPATIEWG
jgi:GMP synthase (glutamine-hydrolysing)